MIIERFVLAVLAVAGCLATAGAVGMGVKDRLKLFPYGTLVGATTTLLSTLAYLLGA